LVEKNCFRYIDLLLKKIGQMLDEQKGILNLSIESAAALDSGFQDELTQMIRNKTGAAGIKMKISIRPELLRGYCLRYKGYFIDASLKGQLDNMAAELTQTLMGSKAARMGGNDG
jgi:F0F1-type ATP synthase delta subunit